MQSGFQLSEEDGAACIQILVVHSRRQYEMTELALGYAASPGHFVPGLQCQVHLVCIVLAGVVGAVGQRQVVVEEVEV